MQKKNNYKNYSTYAYSNFRIHLNNNQKLSSRKCDKKKVLYKNNAKSYIKKSCFLSKKNHYKMFFDPPENLRKRRLSQLVA